jgi:hypothetical protein
MHNTDRVSGYDQWGPVAFQEEIGVVTKGKEWARGYSKEQITCRDKAFRHFDIRDVIRGRKRA